MFKPEIAFPLNEQAPGEVALSTMENTHKKAKKLNKYIYFSDRFWTVRKRGKPR